MRKLLRIFFAVTLLSCTPLSALFAETVRLNKLENGFQYILLKNASSPLAAMQLWVGHGSTNETEDEAGLAHFLEHLTFRSKDIAKRVEDLGGDINAYTSYDRTVYHLTLPAEHWEEGIKALKDIFSGTAFDEESFNKEREVVLEEMKRGYDNPNKMLYYLFFETALKNHPARRPVIGYEKTIKGANSKDVYNFYKKFYVPASSFLTVVGDIDEARLSGKINEYFGAEKNPVLKAAEKPVEPEKTQPETALKTMKIASCYMTAGFPTPGINSPYVPAIDVLSYLYGESATSILNQRLKEEKQLVNQVHSYQISLKDIGFFVVQANFACENADKLTDELFSLLFKEKLVIPEKDLKKVLKSYESGYFFSKERFTEIAADLSSSLFYYNDPDYSKKYIDSIKRIGLKEIADVKERFLTPAALTVALLTPDSSSDIEKTVNKKLAELQTSKNQFAQHTLKNGITLFINRREQSPTVGISIVSLAGNRLEDEKTQGLTGFAVSSLLRGTKSKSYKELLDELEFMGGTLSGFSTKNLSGIKGKFLSDNFEDALKLIRDILVNYSPKPEEIEKAKKLALADIKRKKENPSRVLKDLYFSTVYSGSPLGFPTEGAEESVSEFTRGKAVSQFRRVFSANNLYVAVSGNLPENAVELLKKCLEDIPQSDGKTKQEIKLNPSLRLVKEKYDYKQSHIMIGYPIPGIASPLRPYFQLLSAILSNQSGRLFANLRDKQGLAYAVGSFMYESPESSLFNLYMGTSPEKIKAAQSGLFDELKKIIEEGVTDDELNKAKNLITTDIAQGLQENLDIATAHAQNALLFGDPLFYKVTEQRIKAVTRQDLPGKVKDFFKPENAVVVIVEGKKENDKK